MDPRHTLYKTLDKLTVDPNNPAAMSARTDQEAASVQASSGVTPEGIEKKLKEGLGAEYVEIADLSGMLNLFLILLHAVREMYLLFGCGSNVFISHPAIAHVQSLSPSYTKR